MKWAPADVAQLTYLRARGAGYDAIAKTLSRTRYQVKAKVQWMMERGLLARKNRAHPRGRISADALGIPIGSLPDFRLLRRKGFTADEAVQMIRRWAA